MGVVIAFEGVNWYVVTLKGNTIVYEDNRSILQIVERKSTSICVSGKQKKKMSTIFDI